MAGGSDSIFYRNLNSSDTTNKSLITPTTFPDATVISLWGWTNPGYAPKEWNTQRNGSGTSYALGASLSVQTNYYLIWEADTTYTTTSTELTSIADAIRAKGGTQASLTYPAGFISAINDIPTGGGGNPTAPDNDVVFIDYDGEIRYSYTAAEFAALTALPANPTHSGLIAQGWNWTLADAKTYVAAYGALVIGQQYITQSGATEIDIYLISGLALSPILSCAVNGTVLINWGDGFTSAVTGTSLTTIKETTHTYAAKGHYTISLEATSGTYALYGSSSKMLLHGTSAALSHRYASAVQEVRLGSNASVGVYAFALLKGLKAVSLPSGITSIGNSAFRECTTRTVIVPDTVTSIGSYAFNKIQGARYFSLSKSITSISSGYVTSGCTSLQKICLPPQITAVPAYFMYGANSMNDNSTQPQLRVVIIPEGVTTIGNYAFYYSYCGATVELTIPSTVTSMGSSALGVSFQGLEALHFKPVNPPSVSGSGVFTSLPTTCKIYVPTGSLSAYTSASNYPSSSTYTYVEE